MLAGGPIGAATMSVSIGNVSTCQPNYGTGWGSAGPIAGCQGPGLFGSGYMYNDTTGSVVNTGSASSVAIDAGVLSDTNARPSRITVRQNFRWNMTLEITAAPGEEWMVRMDQSILGLLALLNEVPGDGNGSAQVKYDNNAGMNVWLGGNSYNLSFSPTYTGGTTTKSAELSGSRTDAISGTGSATLTGFARTVIDAYSACLTTDPICSNGPEAAILLGLDDIGGSLPVTADNYSTWGRSVSGDGYNLSFTFVPLPPAVWLFGSAVAALGWCRRKPMRNGPLA